jgi:tetratricopeptide (TPR) repeat protein
MNSEALEKGAKLKQFQNAEGEKAILEAVNELNKMIEAQPGDEDLYFVRAELFYKLNRYGEAMNDYRKVTELHPENKEAAGKIDLLQTILRYHNTDIYASTNTDMDPWLE